MTGIDEHDRLMGMRRFLLTVSLTALAGCLASEDGGVDPVPTTSPAPFDAFCEVAVEGVGTIPMEDDYLPHVVQCENEGADFEALMAQAITARSYAYYKLQSGGTITDGVGDQVYTCSRPPDAKTADAVRATAGQVLMYEGEVVAAFYVAGAKPGDRDTCIASGADADPTSTEHYVTYNEGLSGADIEQTTLGWVNPANYRNRGCMSQWGSRCLEERGTRLEQILPFYYGTDIVRAQASGPCVAP